MNILFVLTSHDMLGDTGRKTGFWLEEFAAPYYVFKEAGANVTLASPKGGQPPLDPKSDEPDSQTDATRRFHGDKEAQQTLANTVLLSSVSHEEFDAVFYPGGHGPLWDLSDDKDSLNIIQSMFAAGKPVAAVCHAPAALRNAKLHNGRPLVEGKQVTGFTNSEEEAVQLTRVVPFLVEGYAQAEWRQLLEGPRLVVVRARRRDAGDGPESGIVSGSCACDAHTTDESERHEKRCVGARIVRLRMQAGQRSAAPSPWHRPRSACRRPIPDRRRQGKAGCRSIT